MFKPNHSTHIIYAFVLGFYHIIKLVFFLSSSMLREISGLAEFTCLLDKILVTNNVLIINNAVLNLVCRKCIKKACFILRKRVKMG